MKAKALQQKRPKPQSQNLLFGEKKKSKQV